jgi:hypothetical protein
MVVAGHCLAAMNCDSVTNKAVMLGSTRGLRLLPAAAVALASTVQMPAFAGCDVNMPCVALPVVCVVQETARMWSNMTYNFDHLGMALISLFVVSTLNGYAGGPRHVWVGVGHRGCSCYSCCPDQASLMQQLLVV